MKLCECGAEPEIVKLFEFAKRYDCFVRCPKCGKETKVYTSRQNAKKAWERNFVTQAEVDAEFGFTEEALAKVEEVEFE